MDANSKRIAKNTFFLYIRMFVMMGVSLYTSRIVLKTLGVEDFGLYNVIGGIVVMFSIFNGALTSSTQRFISYEIGRGKIDGINNCFKTSVSLFCLLGVIILILCETIGLWYVNHILNIPFGRGLAARIVFHFSVFTFLVQIIRVPLNSLIIAYEKMSFFAYISITEAFLKLFIVYMLVIGNVDKLILYSILTFILSIIILLSYCFFCKRQFPRVSIGLGWTKEYTNEMISFSGWNLLGSVANISNSYGVNLILNYFFGVVVNAATGVANQVANAIYGFISNFQMAFNPQIIKLHAQKKEEDLIILISQASKFSYVLMLLLSLPVFFMAHYLLGLWLGTVPDFAVVFCRVILIFYLLEALNGPLWTAITATGNIKIYQIVISMIFLLNIPVAFVMLLMGYDPEIVWITRAIFNVIVTVVRLYFMKRLLNFPVRQYLKTIIIPLLSLTAISFCLFYIVSIIANESLNGLFTYSMAELLIIVLCYIVILSSDEKMYLKKLIQLKLKL